MHSRGSLRMKARQLKIKMNLGLAKVAPLTHLIPEKPRRAVRDALIRITTPRQYRPYRPPVSGGPLTAPLGINEFGMFRAESGLGQGARLYARALLDSGIPCDFVNTHFLDFLPQADHSLDEHLSRTGQYAINLIHINADQMEEACNFFPHRMFDHHYNIGVWLWELERLPQRWLKYFDYVDELWVPSQFIADAARKDTEKPVTVIPYGIEAPADPCTRADFGFAEEDFLVLAMYDSNSFASRKNPEGAIAAFEKAFGGRDTQAALVLKVGNSKPEELEALQTRLRQSGIRYYLVTERLSKPRLNALIACCDVFISLHRSEGFGLVIAEAMLLGVPVVATDWSANVEFMPRECTCRIGCRMVPVGDAYRFGEAAQMWAEPDIDEAAAALRMLQENPERARQMAEAAKSHIRNQYSLRASAEKMKARYDELASILK